jgi:glycine C-acetyltransferase/8-amino-7-oxononanoate synthase
MTEERIILESPLGPRVRINGREYDYFCGTSYYCLHGDRRLIEAACRATEDFGLGPATGWDMPPLREVEELAASFFGTPRARYIISGYLGNFFLLQALRDDYDVVFADEISHYSIRDALAAVDRPVFTFAHLDPGDLSSQLRRHLRAGQRPLVITDAVFPITGALAPLSDYAEIMAGYDGLLSVDDSHGVGVLGERGRGSLEHWGLSGPGIFLAGTLSKAFGGFGGLIPGDEELMDKIAANVRVPIGASPPPIPAAAASAEGLRIVSQHPELRERLRANVYRLREGLRGLGFPVEDSPVPIISLRPIDGLDMSTLERHLAAEGIMTKYVPPHGYSDAPEVGTIRIAVFSEHSPEQLDRLVDVIRRALLKRGELS